MPKPPQMIRVRVKMSALGGPAEHPASPPLPFPDRAWNRHFGGIFGDFRRKGTISKKNLAQQLGPC
jgi:hypothetical protein